ncbi:MAG TPA: TrfB-related DNA-binding protein [Pirellulaceae bacterium]|nr:TrfB-related DNA-binding protein [Pirellulaceae bacterium]
MTAALLENDRIKDRRNQFRREESRRTFLGNLDDGRVGIADCGLLEVPPIVEPPLAAPPTHEPVEPIADTPPPPESAIPNPQLAIDPAAAELLSDSSVRAALGGKVPSRRNRDIFRAVIVARRSQREVAAEHGITQPRVSQIVQQVTAWLSENLVEQDRPRSGLAQIQIAENLVRMQYDHLYGAALDLLHGRTSEAPADADGQDKPPSHKPNAAFLNTALRVVNSRAKFEGVNGRAARRAMDEAEQRGISMFGPTNDNLRRDDGSTPQPAEKSPSSPSYNPLSRLAELEEEECATAEEVSEGFREAYEPYREWFPGDFTARAAYYQTQTERAFGPPPDDEDPRDLECDNIELIHKWDLMAAEAHAEACQQAAREPQEHWPPERLAALRRKLLIEILKRERSVKVDSDAEGLLRCLEYDDASGRFGWDLRFMAMAGS